MMLLKVSSALNYLQFCLSSMVLYTRAYAVWGCDRRILYLLGITYLGSVIGTSFTVYFYIHGISVFDVRLWNGCIYLVTDYRIFYALVSHAIQDTLALGLLLHKSLEHARFMRHLQVERSGSSKVSLMMVMTQDGIAYFILNLVATITNMIVLKRSPTDLRDFLMITQSSVQNVLCARLLFHIQTVNDTSTSVWMDTGMGSIFTNSTSRTTEMNGIGRTGARSDIRFSSPVLHGQTTQATNSQTSSQTESTGDEP